MGVRNKGRKVKISPKVSLRKSVVTSPRGVIEVGRNDPCPCGSGNKYKSCCLSKGDRFLQKLSKKREKEERKEIRKENGGLLGLLKRKSK